MTTADAALMNTPGFWARVDKRGPDDCWEYQGKRTGGYGRVYVTGSAKTRHRDVGAHEIAALAELGPCPPGMIVMHSCDNPPCCNGRHLRYGTHKENSHDARGKGRLRSGWALRDRRKTYCPSGHLYDEDNTYINPRGWRSCRTCRRNLDRTRDRRSA